MIRKLGNLLVNLCIGTFILLAGAGQAFASSQESSTNSFTDGFYVASVEVAAVNINREHNQTDVLVQAQQGDRYRILEDMGDGWLKVEVDGTTGYIPLDGNTKVVKLDNAEEQNAVVKENSVQTTKRQDLVNYAMQFVGGRYAYGGSDPRTGVDCSGFTRYVMQHGAGVSIGRSSQAQAGQGVSVSAEQMQPGDLIFYASGRRINHVALYIGNGQVVHASTARTGIKVSPWNYRQPNKIVNIFGDI